MFSVSTPRLRLSTIVFMIAGSESAAAVLIADDNRDTREMYSLYLSMLGYRVAVAADGREAVQSARSRCPDLIVMDLDMPEVDGWAAIRELQSDPMTATIPVIVVTGHDFKTELKDVAIAVGAVSYLMKPCFPEDLAREVSGRLAVRRARIAAQS
jgi:two-component system, cell cycle response regulator DivK